MNTEWTPAQDQVVIQYFPLGGVAVCRQKLPFRTKDNIRRRAHQLSVYRYGKIPTCINDPAVDTFLLNSFRHGNQPEIEYLIHELQLPRYIVKRRLKQLKLFPGIKIKIPFTEEEDAIITANPHHHLRRIQDTLRHNGFRRSQYEIMVRLSRLQTDTTDPESHTPADIARLLGLPLKTVGYLIDSGICPAQTSPTGVIRISRRDIRDFIQDYPEELDLAKVDREWFIELLCGKPTARILWAKVGGRKVATRDVAHLAS